MAICSLHFRRFVTAGGGGLIVSFTVLLLFLPLAKAEPAASPAPTNDTHKVAPIVEKPSALAASAPAPPAAPAAKPGSNPAEKPPAGAIPASAVSTTPAAKSALAPSTGADDPNRKVRLEFQEQKWLPVLEWLAAQRHLNLDWQKLPDGTLNLASSKEYTIEEAEDLINMQLLARGFTLLQRGEVLRVVPLKDIDITLVPRVTAEELAKIPQHRFVRCTFPLEWMLAEEASNELKPLVSPYGKLFPMAASNRLEAMDAVVNLREVQRLLMRAEAEDSRRDRVAEFKLKHRKAAEVAIKVRMLLGLPPEREHLSREVQTQRDIEQLKFQAEAIKALGANAPQVMKEKPPNMYVVANSDDNTILVNGRPDKIELAREAIEALDKPEPPHESSWETFNRVKTYPLTGIDYSAVTTLIQNVQTTGNFDKETRVQYDPTYNRLIVYATPEDQVTIAGLIGNFHVEPRRAEVLQLTQLEAEYATKVVKLVLKAPERPAAAPGAPSEGRFQIEPDITHNRLLLWATEKEAKEVRDFLTGLGESFGDGKLATQLHIVPLRGTDSAVVAKRLQQVWKEISDSKLIIDASPEEATKAMTPGTEKQPLPAPAQPPAAPAAPARQVTPAAEQNEKPQPMSDRMAIAMVQLASQQQPVRAAEAPKEPKPLPAAVPESVAPAAVPAQSGKDSAVHVIADKDDEMIIVSRDPAAAAAAKQFIEQVVPSSEEVQIIPLKYAQAGVVKTQLDNILAYSRTAQISQLDTYTPLVIEAESRTNRLMIQHATPKQMHIINKVVPMLDQPEQGEDKLARQQQIYRAQRKRASEIAAVIKDVYRDLLSTSDKIFDARVGYRPYGYNQAMAATSKSPEYAGLLSVGIDDTGNSIVLSAPAYLIDEVMDVAKKVDMSADKEKVAVISVTKASKQSISDSLNRILNKR